MGDATRHNHLTRDVKEPGFCMACDVAEHGRWVCTPCWFDQCGESDCRCTDTTCTCACRTTETPSEQISSRFAGEETSSAPSGGESDAPRPPRDVTAGTLSWAPSSGDDPIAGQGWTEMGYVTDGIQLGGDLDETRYDGVGRLTLSTATIEFPRVSRETIMLAMGQDPSEQPEGVPRDWRGRTASDIFRDIIGDTMTQPFRPRIIESELIPPDMVLIGASTLPLDSPWYDVLGERDWWQDGMWAYRAAERIAMQVQRPYGLTVKSTAPTIGRPPRKGRGLTGRRYRAARRAYARKRRAWVRAGSPTYPTAIHMPNVIFNVSS